MKRVFAHIGFSFALTLFVLNIVSANWALVIFSAASVLFIASIAVRKTRSAVAVPLCLICVMLACTLFWVNYNSNYLKQLELDGKEAEAQFYIIDVEENNYYNYVYTVKTKAVSIDGAPQNIKLRLYSDNKIDANYYEIINGKIKLYSYADNSYESRGGFADDIFLHSSIKSYKATGENVTSINKYVLKMRVGVKEFFRKQLPKDNDSVALAIVTGDKSIMSDWLYDAMVQCGCIHLFAVSGLHLSVLSFSLFWILTKLRMRKIPKAVVSLAAIAFYIALAGFSKSVIRAGIMMTVYLIGKLFNEKSDALNSLGLSVFIICLNPYAVMDASVMLTVVSVLGITTINNEIQKKIIVRNKAFNYFLNAVSVSASVFIATFPVMYILFGSVSALGIPLNIVMIPFAQIALVSATLMLVLQKIPPLLFVAGKICEYSTSLIILIVSKLQSFSFAVLNISSVHIGLAIGAVFLLFGIAFIIRRKNTLKITAVISAILTLTIVFTSAIVNYNNVFVREIRGYKGTAYIIYDRKDSVVIGVADNSQLRVVKSIIEGSSLNISMIIDTASSEYSKKLTEIADVKNYVAKPGDDNAKYVDCKNILQISDFDVDLWENLDIQYLYNQPNNEFEIYARVYDSNFLIDTDKFNDYDVVYNVNKNGCNQRRVNKWLK